MPTHAADAPKEGAPLSWYKCSPATPYIVSTPSSASALAYSSALLQLLAQYFGPPGLTISATPSGADAAANKYSLKAPRNNFAAHDWVIDKALSSYATLAWT
ncbi:MAG: hypothetical protein FRX48_07098 [Lasallia pustulata]|uniref:Uncharacterized protein n=1 Tax=Lasallia pustulata TaxID=136370 RepID=A0A5M8PHF0_9LECA|nr:MAG: hypothetical protein FRX48_07098 [Lasallia pustulata]